MGELEGLEEAIRKQAEFIEGLSYSDLPEQTIEQIKLVLLDSIGCMALGNSQYAIDDDETGNYTVVGQRKKSKTEAVFRNGASMVRNELDEGNQFAFGHPACHIIPACLAELENKRISGEEAIVSIAAAYEVSCRWGSGAKLKPAMHVHGTMQTMGAAAVSCKINHCKSKEIKDAIILANSLPQSTSWNSAFEGDQIRNGYIGIANLIGMNAFRMVRMGIMSSVSTLNDVWGNVLEGGIETEKLCDGLGQKYYLNKNYFKIHSACRYTHSFADMLQNFKVQGLKWDEITHIKVETYAAAAKLKGKKANNSFAMRFSIPVSIAVCMIYGDLSVANVTDEHVTDKRVAELAARVSVEENPSYTALLPNVRKNKIEIFTESGKTYKEETDVTKGDFLDPFGREDIIQKFCSITKNVWNEERRRQIIKYVLNLEDKKDVSELFALLGNNEDFS